MGKYKPMRPSDWREDLVKFPVVGMPKVDGVRGVHFDGRFTARTLKPFKNKFNSYLFSHMAFEGLDGELAANADNHPDLCRITSSALGTIDGEPFVVWWLFDFVTDKTHDQPYLERLIYLEKHVEMVQKANVPGAGRLRLMPFKLLRNMEELQKYEEECLDMGYEGIIICDPNGVHKSGTSTAREGGKLRIKRFVDAEARIVAIEEGEANENEATVNALGYTERSSHAENKVPNGMIGALIGINLTTGEKVRVGAGKMSHTDRALYFNNPDLIIGQVMKYKWFPKGIKDKPRFPTFQSFRMEEDL